MARRERGAGPLGPVTSEQRRQVAQSSLALRVDSLLALAGVARWAEIAPDLGAALAPWPGPKSNSTRGAWVFQQSPKLRHGEPGTAGLAHSRDAINATLPALRTNGLWKVGT